jgi:hypothetical protein
MFISSKHFVLVHLCQRKLQENAEVGRQWVASSSVVSTSHGTSFCSIS